MKFVHAMIYRNTDIKHQSISQSLIYYCHNFDWCRDPDIGDNVSPPSYTEATDTSCLEPPTIVPEVSPDENEEPPTYEEAVEDSQHSFSETDDRRPVNDVIILWL